jgi:ankyrin repeat protein
MKNSLAIIVLAEFLIIVHHGAVAGPIHEAAKRGDIQTVRDLVQKGVKINEDLDEYDATALHWSAVKGHRDVAEFLIGKGAIVDQKNRDGDTALHLAVAFGQKDVVQLLLSKSANIDERRREGTTPLYIAVGRNRKDIAELLIASGAEIDARNRDGVTPLYHAAGKNLPDMVALLLSEGADANAPNKQGDTPLHVAVAYGNKNIVGLLLSKGANPSAKNNNGTTPAEFARQQGHPDIAQLLDSKPMFTTYKNDSYKFSIKYPNHWNVLTETQIKSMAAGMSGTPPCFAVQSPTRGSMFVIAGPTTPAVQKAFAADAETGLRQQYFEFIGTPPASWVHMSDSTMDVNGVKALLAEWKMPPIQGVVLIQKHMCLIVGKRSFLISATSDFGSWKEDEDKWFTPAFGSFQVHVGKTTLDKTESAESPPASTNQSGGSEDATGGSDSGGISVIGILFIIFVSYLFFKYVIGRRGK